MIGESNVLSLVRRIKFAAAIALSVVSVSILIAATEAAKAQSTESILDFFGEP
jgi:hypothetical protein